MILFLQKKLNSWHITHFLKKVRDMAYLNENNDV